MKRQPKWKQLLAVDVTGDESKAQCCKTPSLVRARNNQSLRAADKSDSNKQRFVSLIPLPDSTAQRQMLSTLLENSSDRHFRSFGNILVAASHQSAVDMNFWHPHHRLSSQLPKI